jgi:hypothetical protein
MKPLAGQSCFNFGPVMSGTARSESDPIPPREDAMTQTPALSAESRPRPEEPSTPSEVYPICSAQGRHVGRRGQSELWVCTSCGGQFEILDCSTAWRPAL